MPAKSYQVISILTEDGPRDVHAWVLGNWAAHVALTREGDTQFGWVVTYVPSGRNVCEAHKGRLLAAGAAFDIRDSLAESLPEITFESDGVRPDERCRDVINRTVRSLRSKGDEVLLAAPQSK